MFVIYSRLLFEIDNVRAGINHVLAIVQWPSFVGFLGILVGLTGFHNMIPGFTGCYLFFQSFTGFYWVLLAFTGF